VPRDDVFIALAAALPLALFLLREHAVAGGTGLPLDDSWIHLHFARNLAEGAGFSYNPGTPVAGSTAPLWTLLLAGAVLIAGAGAWTAKAVGIVCTLSAALVTRRLVRAVGGSRAAGVGAALALVWAGPMAWGALSGMEVSLAALLVASALLAHAHDRPAWTAWLAALAVLARPESAILLPLLVLARPLSVRRVALFVGVAALVFTPAVWFSLVTAGSPVPATAVAKVEGGLLGWWSGVQEPLATTFVARPWVFSRLWARWLWSVHWALPILLLPAFALTVRQGGRRWICPALALVLHPVAMAVVAPYRGPEFQEGRYSIHLLPLAIAMVWGFGGPILRWLGGSTTTRGEDPEPGGPTASGSPRLRRAICPAAYFAVALVLLWPASSHYAWAVQNINAMQVHLGKWVAGNTPAGARLALNDIGAIAFVSRREVIDLMGLVTPEIRPYRRQGEDGVIRYVAEACPDYVIIFPTWFPRLASLASRYEPIYRVRLSRNEVAGGNEMVVYRTLSCAV
jgi:hypothetical protein